MNRGSTADVSIAKSPAGVTVAGWYSNATRISSVPTTPVSMNA